VADMDEKYDFYFRNLRHFVTRSNCRSIVYTQITDVEHECNGWMTYDREVSKLPKERFAKIHQRLFTPVSYTNLTGSGWEQQKGPEHEAKQALKWSQLNGTWIPVTLPLEANEPLSQNKREPLLALRQSFDLKLAPERAVVEILLNNSAFNMPVPTERLDGVQSRHRETTKIYLYLDGKLLRDHEMSVHAGHGRAVSFLELTDAEVASLKAGRHELGILFPNANGLLFVDANLLQYR
jgi:hypothetical protein